MKRVDDLHDSWNLRVSAALLLGVEEMMAPIPHLETHSEVNVGVSKVTGVQEIAR